MELLNTPWIIALASFLIGTIVGALVFKSAYSDEVKIRQVEDDLEQKEHDFKLYQQSVTTHFSKTSELVHKLTEDYVEVYKHLAEGSDTLIDKNSKPAPLKQLQGQALDSIINEKENKPTAKQGPSIPEPKPPKDYDEENAVQEKSGKETKETKKTSA
jgi:hypothetical protein